MGAAFYLTGVPGTGKSTVAGAVAAVSGAAVFSYSQHLAAVLETQRAELRLESARMVTPEVVALVDQTVAGFISSNVEARHVIVDSHAVTYEVFGFRIVPFNQTVLRSLALDGIICLTAPAQLILDRLARQPDARPLQTIERVEQAQRLRDV